MEATSSVRMRLRASASTSQHQQQQQQRHAEIRLPAEVNWEMLDKTKFFLLGAAMFSGVSGMLYPSMVLKTQQQVAAAAAGNVASASLAMSIVRNQGFPGLYRGFATTLMGTLPARALYMSTLEITKSTVAGAALAAGLSEAAAAASSNAAAGMSAAVAAQIVWTPIDVISQRLMVQGSSSCSSLSSPVKFGNYSGGIDAFRTILRLDGIRGLYRGFGMSIITYAPSNAVWWGSYCVTQRCAWDLLARLQSSSHEQQQQQQQHKVREIQQQHSRGVVLGIQASSAAIAGGVAAVLTTPLDTIKTRMQVLDCGPKPNFGEVLKDLVAQGGWKACYKGLGPRWASMSISATAMITTYELLKQLSAKEEQQQD